MIGSLLIQLLKRHTLVASTECSLRPDQRVLVIRHIRLLKCRIFPRGTQESASGLEILIEPRVISGLQQRNELRICNQVALPASRPVELVVEVLFRRVRGKGTDVVPGVGLDAQLHLG